MVDYTNFQRLATRLIKTNGREVSFLEYANESTSGKPWEVKDNPVIGRFCTKGIFIPPSSGAEFGLPSLSEGVGTLPDLVKLSKQILIIAYPRPGELEFKYDIPPTGAVTTPDKEFDLRNFNVILDEYNGKMLGVTAIQILQPALIKIMAYIGLKD